jgi:hypothetical protein
MTMSAGMRALTIDEIELANGGSKIELGNGYTMIVGKYADGSPMASLQAPNGSVFLMPDGHHPTGGTGWH